MSEGREREDRGRTFDVVAISGNLVASDEHREWISTIVGFVHFAHLHRVIHQIVLNDELPLLAEHLRSIVPHGVETQDFAIHLHVLFQFIEVVLRLVGLQFRSLVSLGQIRIAGNQFRLIDMNTFALQPFLNESNRGDVSHQIPLSALTRVNASHSQMRNTFP